MRVQTGIQRQLPNELLLAIINELVPDTKDKITQASLASFRLASRVFCSVATPFFFSSIELEANIGDNHNADFVFEERATGLNQLLAAPQTTHDIGASVRTLTLRCKYIIAFEKWSNGNLIATILHHLPHIQKFTLESTAHPLRFSLLAKDFSSAVQALCKSPNLATLELGNIKDFPISVIPACPNLRCLRLSDIDRFPVDNVDSMNETSSLQSFYLDSLEIDDYSVSPLLLGISRDQSLKKYFSRIKNLQLHNSSRDWTTMYERFARNVASQSLITLDISSRYTPLVLSFDLGWFPALRHFKIHLSSSFKRISPILTFLNQLLSISQGSTSGIETLGIKITLSKSSNDPFSCLFSSNVGWSTLDEAFTSEKFVSLKKVVLSLETFPPQEEDYYRNLEEYINVLFPLFRASRQHTLETCVHTITTVPWV